MVGMGTAHADDGSLTTDIGLLTTAETDIAEVFNLGGQTDTILPNDFSQLEAIQTPLLSSDNSALSGFGELLFNGPDQQIAQASEAALSAAQAYAADPTATNGLADVSAALQFDGVLLGDVVPANVIGKLTDQIFDIGGFDTASASAAADVATSADSAATLAAVTGTPDEVLGQVVGDLSQGVSVLDAAATADLSADQLNFFTSQETPITNLEPFITQFGSLQDGLPAADQAFVLGADEQLVTAAQNVLSADQALVVADQAGELTGNLNSFDFAVTGADFSLVSDYFGVIGADIIAPLAPLFADFGIPLP